VIVFLLKIAAEELQKKKLKIKGLDLTIMKHIISK